MSNPLLGTFPFSSEVQTRDPREHQLYRDHSRSSARPVSTRRTPVEKGQGFAPFSALSTRGRRNLQPPCHDAPHISPNHDSKPTIPDYEAFTGRIHSFLGTAVQGRNPVSHPKQPGIVQNKLRQKTSFRKGGKSTRSRDAKPQDRKEA